MSIFGRNKIEAKPLNVGDLRTARIAGRIYNLYTWFEQKGGRSSQKDAEMRKALDQYRYALASRGHSLPNSKEDVEHLINA